MISLSDTDRERLARLLGMSGSAHDGEALNAARMADKLVRVRGTKWPDVLRPPGNHRQPKRKAPWRDTIAALLSQRHALRPWEADFLQSLSGFPRLPPKQGRILSEIAQRVLRTETAA